MKKIIFTSLWLSSVLLRLTIAFAAPTSLETKNLNAAIALIENSHQSNIWDRLRSCDMDTSDLNSLKNAIEIVDFVASSEPWFTRSLVFSSALLVDFFIWNPERVYGLIRDCLERR